MNKNYILFIALILFISNLRARRSPNEKDKKFVNDQNRKRLYGKGDLKGIAELEKHHEENEHRERKHLFTHKPMEVPEDDDDDENAKALSAKLKADDEGKIYHLYHQSKIKRLR
jgi:hypothetical protein